MMDPTVGEVYSAKPWNGRFSNRLIWNLTCYGASVKLIYSR
jgi:hypothetical protein